MREETHRDDARRGVGKGADSTTPRLTLTSQSISDSGTRNDTSVRGYPLSVLRTPCPVAPRFPARVPEIRGERGGGDSSQGHETQGGSRHRVEPMRDVSKTSPIMRGIGVTLASPTARFSSWGECNLGVPVTGMILCCA